MQVSQAWKNPLKAWVFSLSFIPYMVTGPYFLDLDPFRSSKSKLELVQFHFPYLKSKSVQFQIRSSSKILQKSSKSIPIGEMFNLCWVRDLLPTLFSLRNLFTIKLKDPHKTQIYRGFIWSHFPHGHEFFTWHCHSSVIL